MVTLKTMTGTQATLVTSWAVEPSWSSWANHTGEYLPLIGQYNLYSHLIGQFYSLDNMKLLLWDCDDRSYSYYIEVSNTNL